MLRESAVAHPVKRGKRWLVTVARPGEGATGKYSAEMLQKYGPIAYPPGTRAYIGHADPGERSVTDLMGTYPDGTFWNEEEQEFQGELEPLNEKWGQLIEELGEMAEASMYSLNFQKDAANNITYIGPHRANSIDIVGFAGLEGSGVKRLIESAQQLGQTKPGADVVQENGKKMDKDFLEAMKVALAETLAPVVSFIADSKAKLAESAQIEADEDAAKTAATAAVEAYDANIALIDAARESLTVTQIESLREAAKTGVDITPLVENAKKITTEVKEALQESFATGRTLGSDAGYTPTAWGSK